MIIGKTNFIFHNVGQGLFYSGEVNFNKSIFQFIYDCGSQKRRLINSAVKRFRRNTRKGRINLLILSHLHVDHTSGINELLLHFKVQDVILPYFYPVERLLIALRRINMPSWYYEFLSNPVSFFMERGVERVIIIGGEKGGEEGTPPSEIPPSLPPEGEPPKIDIEKLPDDEKLKEEILRYDSNWQDYLNTQKLLVKNHNGYITVNGLWLFKFFNYKVPPQKLQAFERCINNLGIDPSNGRSIKEVIRNKGLLRILKNCYNRIASSLKRDFNNTSLVTYHGPIGKTKGRNKIYCFSFFCPLGFRRSGNYSSSLHPLRLYRCPLYPRSINDNNFGQILTGDINLNFRYDELQTHYRGYLDNIVVGQVPHHGATRNWNSTILRDTPNSKFWVISSGYRSTYGHPSLKIIKEIFSKGKTCVWVNEANFLSVRGKIKW